MNSNEGAGRRKMLASGVVVIVLLGAWIVFNPPGGFGYHCFGLSVCSGVWLAVVDVVVHANGVPGIRGSKAHWVSGEEVEWLMGSRSDVVIIGTGYKERVQVEESSLTWNEPTLEALSTPQAIERCNELRKAGRDIVKCCGSAFHWRRISIGPGRTASHHPTSLIGTSRPRHWETSHRL